jgi:putative hydrolase of the HAD superfamily
MKDGRRPCSNLVNVERSLISCAVFDLGGVLVGPEGPILDLAHALEVDAEPLEAAYWRHRDAYDRGGATEDFWQHVLHELVAAGQTPRSVSAERLDAIDAARWTVPAPGVTDLLAQLATHGTTTSVLSNAPATLARTVRAAAWSSAFSDLLFSADVGVMKPEPRIYQLVEERLDRPPAELLFFDDRPVNVAAARERGWRAEVWDGVASAQRLLVEVGALDG